MTIANQEAPLILTDIPGPKACSIMERQNKYLFFNLPTPLPVVWESADGAVVTDVDGNKYIDLSSGVLVMNAGHAHPIIQNALLDQINSLIHSYIGPSEAQVSGLKALADLLPETHQRILPVTTGSEALESAVKIARAFTKKTDILSFFGGFHGRTYLTMAMGGVMAVKKGYGPMPTGHIHAPYPNCYRCPFGLEVKNCDTHCLTYLDTVVQATSTGSLAALVIEPYQGTTGVVVPPASFIEGLRDFCDRHEMLLVFDEVQAGFGRTGKNFAFQHYSYVPDIICVGKGIANGIPTSAVIVRNDISDALRNLSWTSTYAANPLSWASVAASMEVLVSENLADKSAAMGLYIQQKLNKMKKKYPIIGDVRGQGLCIGVEFVKDSKTKEPASQETIAIFKACTQAGLLILPPIGIFGNVIRIVPPLMISKNLVDKALQIIENAIKQTGQSS